MYIKTGARTRFSQDAVGQDMFLFSKCFYLINHYKFGKQPWGIYFAVLWRSKNKTNHWFQINVFSYLVK